MFTNRCSRLAASLATRLNKSVRRPQFAARFGAGRGPLFEFHRDERGELVEKLGVGIRGLAEDLDSQARVLPAAKEDACVSARRAHGAVDRVLADEVVPVED